MQTVTWIMAHKKEIGHVFLAIGSFLLVVGQAGLIHGTWVTWVEVTCGWAATNLWSAGGMKSDDYWQDKLNALNAAKKP